MQFNKKNLESIIILFFLSITLTEFKKKYMPIAIHTIIFKNKS